MSNYDDSLTKSCNEHPFHAEDGIEILNLSPAVYHALIVSGFNTLEKIANITDKEISKLRNIGEKRKLEVINARELCKSFHFDIYMITLNGTTIGDFKVLSEFPNVYIELDKNEKILKITSRKNSES